MNILIKERFGLFQKLAGDYHRRGGAVSNLIVLSLGHLDDHLGHRVLDVHLSEDGCAVIGDRSISAAIDEHLVHSLRSKGGPDGFSNRLCC